MIYLYLKLRSYSTETTQTHVHTHTESKTLAAELTFGVVKMRVSACLTEFKIRIRRQWNWTRANDVILRYAVTERDAVNKTIALGMHSKGRKKDLLIF